MASAILAEYFLRTGCSFFNLGKTWLQMPWMHVKLGFVFALLFISWQMPSDKQLQTTK
jgi:hypothetical protein